MEKIGNIKEGQNCLVVSLSGDQSYVKIFDSDGKLIRDSLNPGTMEIRHMATPGEYRIETDGTIKRISSVKLVLEEDPNNP